MQDCLKGKVAIVTGAGSGIGAAIACALSQKGCKVALLGRHLETLDKVAKSFDGTNLCVPCDVQDEASIAEAVRKVQDTLGPIEILVNNAGIFTPAEFGQMTTDMWDRIMNTNLRGTFLMCRYCWSDLCKNHGQIINISSIAGTQGYANSSAYCASKFGMNGLSAVLAIEGRNLGVRVNTICPAEVETNIWGDLATENEKRRMIHPGQIAEVAIQMLESGRNIQQNPIIITNTTSPWSPAS